MLLALGVDSRDLSLTYDTQCSSQQVPSSMPITHFPLSLAPPCHQVCSLYLRVSSGLPPSLFVTIFPLPLPHGLLLTFSRSTYEWEHMISVFLWLTSFTHRNTFQLHPRCCQWQDFILSHCQVVFHCIRKPHLLYEYGSFYVLSSCMMIKHLQHKFTSKFFLLG